jgi:hypothetical protein
MLICTSRPLTGCSAAAVPLLVCVVAVGDAEASSSPFAAF